MQNIVSILKVILPLLVSLGIGFLARRRSILSPEAIDGMKTFVVKFALPAMLFGLFFTAEYSPSVLLFAVTMFALGFLGLGLGFLIGKPLERRSPMLKYMTAGWEVGMLGYALYALLFGAENLRYMALMDFGQVLFVFSGFVAALNVRSGHSAKDSFKLLIVNPIPWAMLAGAVLAILGVSRALEPSGVTALIASVCSFIASPLSCLIFIVVGYGISFSKKNIKTALIAVAMRALVCAILCLLALWIIGRFVPLSDPMRWAIILISITPAPFILTMYTNTEQESADVSMSLSLQTLASVLAFIMIVIIRQAA